MPIFFIVLYMVVNIWTCYEHVDMLSTCWEHVDMLSTCWEHVDMLSACWEHVDMLSACWEHGESWAIYEEYTILSFKDVRVS